MTTKVSGSAKIWPALVMVMLIAFFFRFYQLANHPLGLFFDPAINGLDAVRLLQRGGHVLFFPTNGGRESLFMVMLIPFIWLFDTTPFAIRMVTATLSLLTVAMLFAFLHDFRRALLPAAQHRSQIPDFLPLLGTLVLATSYWHISVSRLGQRPILTPTLAVPLFWLFLKGWRSGRWHWFMLSGLLMGLAGYTYAAARLLPVILLLAVLPEFFGKKQVAGSKKQAASTPIIHNSQFKNLLLFVLTAATIYLPMAWYLLNHPAQFTARAGSVMVWNFLDSPIAIVAELGRNALRVAGFFCCAGSPNPIFGPPGYPGLSLLLAPFLLIGLAVTLKQWRSLPHRLITLWWLIGISPSIVAIEAPHPLRMIVAIPPTAILVGLGLRRVQLSISNYQFPIINDQLPESSRHAKSPTPYSLLITHYSLLILPFLPLPILFHSYFNIWTDLQVTRGIYDYGAVAIRDAVLAQAKAQPKTPIYLPLDRFNDSTLLYYLSGSFERQAALTADSAEKAVAIAPADNAADAGWVRLLDGTATVLPPLKPAGQRIIQTALAGETARPILSVGGEVAARLASLPTDPAQYMQPVTTPLDVSFGPVRLSGANFPFVLPESGPVTVTLFWQANQSMSNEFEVLLRLVDDQQRAWGNGDARPTGWVYPTSFWRPGLDHLAVQQPVALGPDLLPPGRYWLAVSIFDPARGLRLPLTQGQSNSPDTFFIGPLKIAMPPPPADAGQRFTSQPAVFGKEARLIGFSLNADQAAPGETIQLDLLWEAQRTPPQDYTVFVHLLDAGGNLVAGSDSQPVSNQYPTSIWSSGERILDRHTLILPPKLETSRYSLAIGLYHQPTSQRLPLIQPGKPPDYSGRLELSSTIMVSR